MVKSWTAADMAVSVRLMSPGLPYKMLRADVLPYVVEVVVVFSVDIWQAFLRVPTTIIVHD